MEFKYNKILIIGCGGAGKSTLACIMGEKFNLPVVHLDKLHWLPNWIERPTEQFDKLLLNELLKPQWIIDGNFNSSLDLRLKYADLCIFLDYDTDLCLKSVQERVEKYKGKTRPDMTEGCLEQVDDEFVEWINNYKQNVRPQSLQLVKNSKVDFLIFTIREQTDKWLDSFK